MRKRRDKKEEIKEKIEKIDERVRDKRWVSNEQ
jgi:hypothetical protein